MNLINSYLFNVENLLGRFERLTTALEKAAQAHQEKADQYTTLLEKAASDARRASSVAKKIRTLIGGE